MHNEYPHRVLGTKQSENAIGKLESDIYRDLGMRPHIYELFDMVEGQSRRVLVIDVPSHPIGKVYKFEDVPLMRVGEELKPMDDKTYISIIQEQEPDFSQLICDGATFDDLDSEAISILKHKYSKKQNNLTFISISDEQALSDLNLIGGNRITNAAILLVGKKKTIERFFPQSKVFIENRNVESQIPFDSRKEFCGPFFQIIDQLWDAINMRNGYVPIQEGMYYRFENYSFLQRRGYS